MRSCHIVILRIRTKHMAQVSLAEDDEVIKALASNRADQPFGVAVLPRRSRCCWSVTNTDGTKLAREHLAVDPVAITDEILRRGEREVHIRPGRRAWGPRTGQSRRSRRHDSGGTFSSPWSFFYPQFDNIFRSIASTERGQTPVSTNPGIAGDDTVSICISSN